MTSPPPIKRARYGLDFGSASREESKRARFTLSNNDEKWRKKERSVFDKLWVNTPKGLRYAWLSGKYDGSGPLYSSADNAIRRPIAGTEQHMDALQDPTLYPNRHFLTFNPSQRGELVEAYGQWYYPSYISHQHDDFIVDGYDRTKRVDPKETDRRLTWIRRNASSFHETALNFKQIWNANNRGLYELAQYHSSCVPVEWKTTREKYPYPTVAQLLYLYLFQGKLLTVQYNIAEGFKLIVTDFSDSATKSETQRILKDLN